MFHAPLCKPTLLILLAALLPVINVDGAESPRTFKVGEFTFERPTEWQWVKTRSTMRKAQLKIKGSKSDASAEVVFFYFGQGGAGGTKANVDRWLSQFQEPRKKIKSKVESETLGKWKVTHVEAEGTYLSGRPGGPKKPVPNTMLLGAIVESDAGDVFIRLTGPTKIATSSRDAFRKMIAAALGAK